MATEAQQQPLGCGCGEPDRAAVLGGIGGGGGLEGVGCDLGHINVLFAG
jgi:hypothetical protein